MRKDIPSLPLLIGISVLYMLVAGGFYIAKGNHEFIAYLGVSLAVGANGLLGVVIREDPYDVGALGGGAAAVAARPVNTSESRVGRMDMMRIRVSHGSLAFLKPHFSGLYASKVWGRRFRFVKSRGLAHRIRSRPWIRESFFE